MDQLRKVKIHKLELALLIIQKFVILSFVDLGAIFILRKDIGVGGWSRKWQFSLTLCSENVLTYVGGWFKKASENPYVI